MSPNIDWTTIDFKNQVVFSEAILDGVFKKFGKIVVITYMGESKAHPSGTTLFTLPDFARPSRSQGSNLHLPFTTSGNNYGNIVILADGEVKVNYILDTTREGRVTFSVAYFTD